MFIFDVLTLKYFKNFNNVMYNITIFVTFDCNFKAVSWFSLEESTIVGL